MANLLDYDAHPALLDAFTLPTLYSMLTLASASTSTPALRNHSACSGCAFSPPTRTNHPFRNAASRVAISALGTASRMAREYRIRPALSLIHI